MFEAIAALELFSGGTATVTLPAVIPGLIALEVGLTAEKIALGSSPIKLQSLELVPSDIHVAGKTGTAEYCDSFAYPKGWCIPGNFPTHAWTLLYAPAEKPEVSVIVFVNHGGEGSRMAAPIAGSILRAYFELKKLDTQPTGGN